MKKFIYIAAGVLAALTLVVVVFTAMQPKITYYKKADVVQKFENDESFLFVVGLSTCPSCTNYKEMTLVDYLSEDAEYPLVYMNRDQGNFLGNEDLQDFLDKYKMTLPGTPTTYLVINGEVVDQISGPIKLNTLKEFIEENKN